MSKRVVTEYETITYSEKHVEQIRKLLKTENGVISKVFEVVSGHWPNAPLMVIRLIEGVQADPDFFENQYRLTNGTNRIK